MPLNRVYERIEQMIYLNFRIRMWCRVESLGFEERYVCRHQLRAALTAIAGAEIVVIEEIAERLSELDFCNAIEVIAPNGNGVIIYPSWP